MARPFAWIGFTFFVTLFTAALYGRAAAVALALVGGIALVFSLILTIFKKAENKRRALAVLGAVIIVAVGWMNFYTRLSYKPAMALAGKQVAVEAEITDYPVYQYNRWYYSVRAVSINGQSCSIPVRYSSAKSLDAEPYDKIRADMYLYRLGGDSNRTEIKYKAMGVVLGGYSVNASAVKVQKVEDKPFNVHILNFRRWIKNQLKVLLPGREGALLQGMILGDKSDMTREEEDWFRITGTSHLMAVSGLHFSIWLAVLMLFLNTVKAPKKLKPILGIIFVLFFAALTGFTASVTRAGLMMIIVLFGKLFWEQADSLNSLGIAAVIILLQNPYASLDLGFLLSFSSTAGILVCSPILINWIKKMLSFISGKKYESIILFFTDTVCITVSAIIFTLPIQVFFIGEISLIAPISNLLMTNAGGTAMVLAGIAVLLSRVPIISFLQYPCALAAGLLAKYLLWVARRLAEIPHAQVRADLLYVKLWVIVTVGLIIFSVFVMNKNKTFIRMTAAASIVLLVIGTVSYNIVHKNETVVDVLDVGNGTAVLVVHDGRGALIGCGGDYFAESQIRFAMSRYHINNLTLLFVPRQQETESSAVGDVLADCKTEYLVSTYNGEEFNVVPKNKKAISQSGEILLWDSTTLQYINNGTQSASLLTVGNTKILISFCPGTRLSELPQDWYCADALISRADVPEDAPSYTVAIISGESDKAENSAALYKKRSTGAVLTTSGKGSVQIITKGDSRLSVGRKNNGIYWGKRIKTAN